MADNKIPYKIYLEEQEMPKAWYNVRADMKNKPAPLLNPGTLKPMTFEELSQIHREEMKVKALTSCRPDLYRAMADLLNRLRNEYTKQISIDPDSVMSEGANLHRKNAETIAKVIISLRAKKIATKAVLSADGANEDLGSLTPEERDYYFQLVDVARRQLSLVDRYRGKTVVDTHIDDIPRVQEPAPVKEPLPDIPVDEPMPADDEPFPMDEPEMFDDMVVEESFDDVPEPESASPQAVEPEPVQTETEVKSDDTVVIRVLEDLPPFVGPDRDYDLHKEDVVTLPRSMAELLVRTEKAVPIAPSL